MLSKASDRAVVRRDRPTDLAPADVRKVMNKMREAGLKPSSRRRTRSALIRLLKGAHSTRTSGSSQQLKPLQHNARSDRDSGFRVPDNYDARQIEGRWHLVRPKT